MSNPNPSIPPQVEAQIISNNRKISELLTENEMLLRQSGLEPPVDNYAPSVKRRIHFPTKYIRTKAYYVNNYHLRSFFSNEEIVSNVAYSLQMSDLYNFILNRFYVFGSLETMIYKAAIINYVCIIESLIGQVYDDMHSFCGTCPDHNHCEFFMPKVKTFAEKLKAIESKGMLTLSPDQFQQIREAYHLRNQLHIYTAAKNNEFTTKSFDRKLHNRIVIIMKNLKEILFDDLLPATKQCYRTLEYKDI